jgi:hypothetical protein
MQPDCASSVPLWQDRKITRRERKLLWLLGSIAALAAIGIAAMQIFGGEIGAACADSYSCRGFLVGGSECVDVGRGSYCTRYCKVDRECPSGWTCLGANPTVLTVETRAVGKVCVRDR